MWIHIGIFVIVLGTLAGWRMGWISADGLGGKRGKRLFALVALGGNCLGLLLTAGSGNGQVYSSGYRLEKEETGSYEERFMVSVDGEETGALYIQVPEKELEEEQQPEQEEELTREERRRRELMDVIAKYNQEKNDPDYYYLPEEWDGKHLEWERPADNSGTLLSSVFFVAALVLMVIKAREQQTLQQQQYEQLLMDYPGLVMKFTLLIQAGMTVRKAFQKIALDYKRKRQTKERYAYEQILAACYEMDSGISEAEAYRRFGERCGQVKYKTFSTLLIQNLQKGSRYLADMLEQESAEAWDERKRKARVLGEAAATKLLIPMVLMLLVVMAIIMIPACLSFYGGG